MATIVSNLSHRDESGVWFPLRRDGAWLKEEHWQRNLPVLRDPRDGCLALSALREVFTEEWSRAQRGAENLHPVVRDALTVGGRHQILQVGAMLREMPQRTRLRSRLLAADEYQGTCAELRTGLFLRAAGASLESEPVRSGSGPDWLARWTGGALAVEVKCPRVSARAAELQRIEMTFFLELTSALSKPPLRVDAGVWLTFHPRREVIAPRTATGLVDIGAVLALARDAAAGVRENMPTVTIGGRFSAGPVGDFSVNLGAGDEPRVLFDTDRVPSDDDHDTQRVFETIQGAARQLGRVDGVPGLIVLDAAADFMLLNQRLGIRETLRTEPWAKGLAGLALVTQISSADEQLGESRLDTMIDIMPGAQFSALEHTLLPGLRRCDRNHLHVDALLAPSERCPHTL